MFFFDEDKQQIFKSKSVELAYLNVLNDDIKAAQTLFQEIDSPRARWGKSFTDILSGYIERYPTYFEIRNFLEIDLDFLIKNEKIDYIEQFLGSLTILAGINQEVYKYVARVMLENKHYRVAFEYLEKSKKTFYKDPELHFLYTKYFLKFNQYKEALLSINECLKILPDYFPAKKLKQEIENSML